LNATVFAGNLKPDSDRVNQIKITDVKAYAANIESDVWCVSSWSENTEFAENLFTLLSQDETLNNLLYYGIEGVSYSCDNGKVTATDTEEIFGSQATIGNELLLIENKPLKEQYESYNDSLEVVDLSKYDFSEFDADFAEFAAIINEYDDILTGESADYENRLAQLSDSLDNAGFNDAIDKINAILNAT
jgi:putative aldouronate transport system substrate-binding protein